MATSTFSITANADDVLVQRLNSAVYPPSTATDVQTGFGENYAGRSLSGGNYQVRVSLLRFDTSSLPDDASIVAATLRLHVTSRTDTNSLSVLGEYHDWDSANIAASYTAGVPASPILSKALASFVVGVQNDCALSDLSGISKTGLTEVRVVLSQRAGDAAPTGVNQLAHATAEAATPEPQLLITYDEGDLVGAVGI